MTDQTSNASPRLYQPRNYDTAHEMFTSFMRFTDALADNSDLHGLAQVLQDELSCAVNAYDRLTAENARLREALGIITLNASAIPDPAMSGATETYSVPLDDIDSARALLERMKGE